MSWWGLLRAPFATVGFLADIAIQSAVVQRSSGAFSWPEALTKVEDESDALEPGELNHRFYCNRCGGGYYTGQHNCLRDSPTAPPAVGDDPEGLEPPPARPSGSPRESSGIDYDRLAGGPW